MKRTYAFRTRLLSAAVSLLLCGSMTGMQALAADADSAEQTLPASFDLRNVDGMNFVTPVKHQNYTGTCWAHAAIAAAEISIQYQNWVKNGIRPEDSQIDLSELQEAWFATHPIPEDDPAGTNEPGEGYFYEDWPNSGGTALYLGALLFSGVGPIAESDLPMTDYLVNVLWVKQKADGSGPELDEDGNEITETHPLDWEHDGSWKPMKYLCDNTDYKAPEDLRIRRDYRVNSMRFLDSPALRDEAGNYAGFNEDAAEAMKRELVSGTPLLLSFYADIHDQYLSADYAQYVYQAETPNHMVCIVGYDDNYSRDHFKQGTAEDGTSMTPPADGAWIIKNSWGDANGKLPCKYGLEGVDGSGYFYISYYDKSIEDVTAWEFDCEKLTEQDTIFQHDLMIPGYYNYLYFEMPTWCGNLFVSDDYCWLNDVTIFTPGLDMTANYQLYRISSEAGDDFNLNNGMTKLCEFERTYSQEGFYREKLPEPVAVSAGDRFIMFLTLTDTAEDGTEYYYAIIPMGSTKELADEWNARMPQNMQLRGSYSAHYEAGDSWFYFDTDAVPEEQRRYDLTVYDQNLRVFADDSPEAQEAFGVETYVNETGMVYDSFPIKMSASAGEAPEVKLSLTSDKSSYQAGETAVFTLKAENCSADFDLPDVFAESSLCGNAEKLEIGRIPAGTTKEISYTYTVSDTDAAAGTINETLKVTVGANAKKPMVLEAAASARAEAAETTTTAPAETEPQPGETGTTVTEPDKTKPFASDDALCEMSVKDYQAKHGELALNAASEKKDGNLIVTLTDADGNVRDTYTIDPMTGKGVSADGSAVDLPQTGITAAGSLLTVLAAFLMTAFGTLAVCGSGILRRRKDSE